MIIVSRSLVQMSVHNNIIQQSTHAPRISLVSVTAGSFGQTLLLCDTQITSALWTISIMTQWFMLDHTMTLYNTSSRIGWWYRWLLVSIIMYHIICTGWCSTPSTSSAPCWIIVITPTWYSLLTNCRRQSILVFLCLFITWCNCNTSKVLLSRL